jgi:hypothetical protein
MVGLVYASFSFPDLFNFFRNVRKKFSVYLYLRITNHQLIFILKSIEAKIVLIILSSCKK